MDYPQIGQFPQPAHSQSDKFELQTLFNLFLRNWYWLALGLLIGGTIAWLQLRYATVIYEVRGSVLINADDQQPISEQIIARDLGFQGGSNVANELQILKSATLMQRVVDSLGINITYFTEGRIKTTEIYPYPPVRLSEVDSIPMAYGRTLRLRIEDQNTFALLRGEDDTLRCRFGLPFEYAGQRYTIDLVGKTYPGFLHQIKIERPDQIARRYAGKLNLEGLGQSNVITMSMRDPVARKAVDVMNGIIRAYDNSILENKNRSGEQTLAFIDERLGFITRELYDVEREVEGFRRSNELPVEPSTRASGFLQQVQYIDEQIMELDLKLTLLEELYQTITDEDQRYQPLPLSSEILPSTLTSLVQEYNTILFERDQLLETATPQNPAVATNDEKLDFLRQNLELGITTVQREFQVRKNSLQDRLQPLEDQIKSVPTNERQLLQIMRQQQIKEQLFLYLLQKREETALSIAAQTPNTRVLNSMTNAGKVKPNRPLIFFLAFTLGFGIPGLVIFMRHYYDNKIYTKDHIQKKTQTPFLGTISQSRTKTPIAITRSSRSAIAEQFRLLRTNLNFFLNKEQTTQVVLVTSSVSGEGKSFVTINLGLSLALSGKKVILLGMDLRKPKMGTYLTGTRPPLGLTNYLVGEDQLEELIQPVPGYENIDFLDCGVIPPNPADLLTGSRVDELFAELRQHYDFILVDTAPIGLVTDALLLGPHTDLSILVTRQGKTTTQLLEGIEEIFQKQKLPNMGILLNGVKARGIYGYGGYGYGYGYGAGYYQEDTPKRKSWPIRR